VKGQPPERPAPSLVVGEDVHRVVKDLRLIGVLAGLAMVLVVVAGLLAVALRAARPVAGGLSAIVLAGIVAVAALAGGATALELWGRHAKRAPDLQHAISAYALGCAVAGGANFLAGAVTVIVVFANGVSGGLWIPDLLVLAISVMGLILAVPRMKHVRELYYRPTLPVSRI